MSVGVNVGSTGPAEGGGVTRDVALRAEGVWLRHDRRSPWVLADVSLELPAGEVLGLQGPSGIGKSTLGRVLSGLLRPGRGVVSIADEPVRRPCRDVQYLVQDPASAMNPRWRVERILAEAGGAVEAEEALVESPWLERFAHELSGGQLQRVNLARALRARPRFLVADEITASLDAITQAQVWHDLLVAVRERGIGVLAISHDPALLAQVCDRVEVFPAAGRDRTQG